MKSIVLLIGILLAVAGDVCAQDYNGFLRKLAGYQKSVKLSYRRPVPVESWKKVYLNPETFNMDDYMALYPALKVRPGYKVDHYYHCNSIAGIPYLYARDTGMIVEQLWDRSARSEFSSGWRGKRPREAIRKSRLTGKEKEKWEKELRDSLYDISIWGVRATFALDSANSAKHYLIPEDNEMGYLQLVMFYVIGDNFGWFWHANYGYHYILYESAQLEELIRRNREEDDMVCLKEKELRKLLKQDVTPQVKMEEEFCRVTFYEFSTFGIFRKTYTVGRKAPYPVKRIEETRLLDNDIRVIF